MKRHRLSIITGVVLVLLVTIGMVSNSFGFAKTAKSAPDVESFDSDYVYKQILAYQIPARPDGAPTYFPWGRHYVGKNGWEIRLNHEGTRIAAKLVVLADAQIVGAGAATLATSLINGTILASVSPAAMGITASAASDVTGAFVGDKLYDAVLKDRCLGITIPSGGVVKAITRGLSLLNGNFSNLRGPYDKDIKAWLEPCAPGDGPKADVVAPPAPPPVQAVDTQPVEQARPIVKETPRKLQPTQAPPPPVVHHEPAPPVVIMPPPAPEPTYIHVSMDEACLDQYGDGSHSQYLDPQDAGSWVCQDDSGYTLGDLSVQDFCNKFHATAVIVQDDQIPAYWWKCQQ